MMILKALNEDPIPLCPTIYMFVQMPASPDIHAGADPRGNGYRDS